MTELEEFRKQKDIFLGTDRHSPLTAGQRKDFNMPIPAMVTPSM
jgi:hypothetical protein